MSNFRIVGCLFLFFIKFILNILQANSEDPDQRLHFTVSKLGLHCLSVSHKKEARLKWVEVPKMVDYHLKKNTDDCGLF